MKEFYRRVDSSTIARSVDVANRTVRFLAQSTALASDSLVITPDAGKRHNPAYMRNPIVVPDHMRYTPDGDPIVVGSVQESEFTKEGMYQTVKFAETDRGEQYWQLYRDGHMRMVSIAWSRDDVREIDPVAMGKTLALHNIKLKDAEFRKLQGVVTEYKQRDLSLVPIGADPKALARTLGDDELTRALTPSDDSELSYTVEGDVIVLRACACGDNGRPFAGYQDFRECVTKNNKKDNPEGFCAALHKQVTGKWPEEVKEKHSMELEDWETVLRCIKPEEDVCPLAVLARSLGVKEEEGLAGIVRAFKDGAEHPMDFAQRMAKDPSIKDPFGLMFWLYRKTDTNRRKESGGFIFLGWSQEELKDLFGEVVRDAMTHNEESSADRGTDAEEHAEPKADDAKARDFYADLLKYDPSQRKSKASIGDGLMDLAKKVKGD